MGGYLATRVTYHVPEPGAPCSILQPVTEASEYEQNNQNGIWRMKAEDQISDETARWCDDRDASLPKSHVYEVVTQCRRCVAQERTEEDQGNNRVCEVVIPLEVRYQGAVAGVVKSKDEKGVENSSSSEFIS